MLAAIVLVRNEEIHIARCLQSLHGLVDRLLVVDCFSTDRTTEIAAAYGAQILQNKWVNYSSQFNWALEQLERDTTWVLRIDADEVVTPALATSIRSALLTAPVSLDGYFVERWMCFQGVRLRYGGAFPMRVLRLFRYGRGRCESRWMDEHIVVPGQTGVLNGELVDDNLNDLTWWTAKHNGYASREVVDLLNIEMGFLDAGGGAGLGGSDPARRRWLKEKLYSRLPGGGRALLYFFYRYFLRLGFLDGRAGFDFHVLQGLWYRFLVDAKLREVTTYMKRRGVGPEDAIFAVLGIKVR